MFVVAGLGVGGAERVISLISSAWAERGWEVTIVAFDAPEDRLGFAFDPRIRLVRLGIASGGGLSVRGIGETARRIVALRRILRANRADIVLSFLTKINVITLLAAIGLPDRVVISERNNPHAQGGHPLWAKLWLKLARRAKGIVLQTETIRLLYPAAIAARAKVIPNPVEVPAFERKPHAGKVLVGAGRLETQKGFDLLIAAFAAIAGRHEDWRLVIWGEGSKRSELESLVQQHRLGTRIALPGNSPAPLSWVEDADLFVMSSRYEGFGNVLAEAMLAGLPVVSFDCNFGPRDIVEDGVDGVLVERENTRALAETLSRLMGDPAQRARLTRNAAQSARRFNPADIIAMWDDLVTEITGERRE